MFLRGLFMIGASPFIGTGFYFSLTFFGINIALHLLYRNGAVPKASQMKNKTIIAALYLGFTFDKFSKETELSEVYQSLMDFLMDNQNELPKEYDECEVSGNGSRQYVNHGDFSSSGEIIDWHYYYDKPRQKVEHSSYVIIAEDGTPMEMVLWCWSMTEQQAKERDEPSL
jgi:hypothetical protein